MAITENVDYLQRCVPLGTDFGGSKTMGAPSSGGKRVRDMAPTHASGLSP
jgi:hypothetical protein